MSAARLPARAQRGIDHQGQEQSGKTCIPHPAHRPLHDVGKKRPDPGCDHSNPYTDRFSANRDHDYRSQSGEQAVHRGNHPGGSQAVHAENFEDARQQQRINRRIPRRRSGAASEWRAEAVPFDNGLRDSSDFVGEGELIGVRRLKPGMKAEIDQANQQRHGKDSRRRRNNSHRQTGSACGARNFYSFAVLCIQGSVKRRFYFVKNRMVE